MASSSKRITSAAVSGAPGRRAGIRRGEVWHPANASHVVQDFSAERNVGTALRETFKAFARSLGERVGEIGLSLNGWFALRTLWEKDGLTQVELARALDITPASIVGIVNTLERAGLVERRRSPRDRRARQVCLTAAGRRLRAKATALALQVDARALEGVPVRELESTLTLLARLRENLASDTDAPSLGRVTGPGRVG